MNKEYCKVGSPFVRLAEECSEVIKVCMKIERFGLNNYHPKKKVFNFFLLEEEIKDVKRCIKEVEKIIEECYKKGEVEENKL
ncbi:MAG: hypothetical protein LBF97_03660 [Elusimicrobiota bacterium]|jgi:hypothetical protein|nr:hypothetical protein [Elusimicrobiota bacterium]